MKANRLVIIVVMLFIVVYINILRKDLWDINEELLKEEVLSVEETDETVNLSDITPFEWDIVYSFDPYTSKDTIYETVGYKWDRISETVNEGMNQIVFLNDEKVVCYLYGYPENNGYGIYFISKSKNELPFASVLRVEDDLTFQIEKSNDVVYLRNN